jgi:hypothetical protein
MVSCFKFIHIFIDVIKLSNILREITTEQIITICHALEENTKKDLKVISTLNKLSNINADELPNTGGFYWLAPNGKFVESIHHTETAYDVGEKLGRILDDSDLFASGAWRVVIDINKSNGITNAFVNSPYSSITNRQLSSLETLKERRFHVSLLPKAD